MQTAPINKAKSDYKEQVRQLRENAILAAVNRLLASRGYDFMTVDEVALEAGMAKASLYKHFASKEELAAAAMVQVLDLALREVNALRDNQTLKAIDKLKHITRWAMLTKLEGQMPSLPVQNSTLSNTLKSDEAYMERLFDLTAKLSIWLAEAQSKGEIRSEYPTEMLLYLIFARACDPVLEMMHSSGNYEKEQILDLMLLAHFGGMLSSRGGCGS